MITQRTPLRPAAGARPRINRTHSTWLAVTLPWLSVMVGSVLPAFMLVAGAPLVPPAGFMILLAWRLIRPDLFAPWAAIPLGLFDDMFSGQPLGCGIMLWPLAMFATDFMEARFPWREVWQNWLLASVLLTSYLVACTLLAGAGNILDRMALTLPQIVLGVLAFPMAGRVVAHIDRLRLLRIRRLN